MWLDIHTCWKCCFTLCYCLPSIWKAWFWIALVYPACLWRACASQALEVRFPEWNILSVWFLFWCRFKYFWLNLVRKKFGFVNLSILVLMEIYSETYSFAVIINTHCIIVLYRTMYQRNLCTRLPDLQCADWMITVIAFRSLAVAPGSDIPVV